MFTANSKYYLVGSNSNDGVASLVDRKDGSIIYANKCKFFDINSGIALIFKDGKWNLTNSSARIHPDIDVQQILSRVMAEVSEA